MKQIVLACLLGLLVGCGTAPTKQPPNPPNDVAADVQTTAPPQKPAQAPQRDRLSKGILYTLNTAAAIAALRVIIQAIRDDDDDKRGDGDDDDERPCTGTFILCIAQ